MQSSQGEDKNEIPNAVGMSHLREAWDTHTQQAEVCNQLLFPSASTRKATVLSDPNLAETPTE